MPRLDLDSDPTRSEAGRVAKADDQIVWNEVFNCEMSAHGISEWVNTMIINSFSKRATRDLRGCI